MSPGQVPKIHRVLRVNGSDHNVVMSPATTLLRVLRDHLGLTAAKEACGRGECGACTVLIDGVGVLSCLTLAVRVIGEVTTAELVAEQVPEVCAAFADCAAFQCGFCTPGQVVRVAEIVAGDGSRDEDTLRRELSGNICRCTGYAQIVDAVRLAAEYGRAVR